MTPDLVRLQEILANNPLLAVLAAVAAVLLIGCIILAVLLAKRGNALHRKAIDDERWQGNIAELEHDKAEVQTEIDRQEREADRLSGQSRARQKEIAAAQEISGLPETEGEAYLDWLRKRETAEEKQADLAQFCREQQSVEEKAALLLARLRQCDEAMPFMQNLSERLPAWVEAAKGKLTANHEAEQNLRAAEKERDNLAEILRQKRQNLADLSVQAEQAEADWQAETAALFGGRINAEAAKNIAALEQFADIARQAARAAAAQRENNELLAAALRELPQIDGALLKPGEIAAALPQAEAEREALDKAYRQAVAEKTQAQTAWEAIGKQDKTAELEQQKATLEIELQDLFQTYAEQSLGLQLAQTALSIYREKHRSGMMQAAEKAFAELTNDSYPALQTRPDGGNSEILLAVSKDGESLKRADEMSKGTRFQLYMALRAAAYEQLLEKNISLPFFCDDVFESFDDERTRAACRLMQHIGRQGQAIYFTHHNHVAEIAKEICGDNVQIHAI